MKIKDLLECELLIGGGGGGYPEPKGDVTITENGQHNVKDYATATVNVPQPSGSTNITENGTHNVKDFEQAIVNVSGYPEPQGSVTIQANGTYNVKDKATAVVDVPQPSGNKAITENGTYNVKDYAYAVVNVSGYPEPEGDLTITENGEYYIKDYETATVDVPQPSGSTDITENGTFDITQFAQAVVQVQPSLQSKTVTENGIVTADEGYDGLSVVMVDVPTQEPIYVQGTYKPSSASKSITIPQIIGKNNVLLFHSSDDLNSVAKPVHTVQIIDNVKKALYYTPASSGAILKPSVITPSFKSTTGTIDTLTTDHKFSTVTYTYVAW